MARCYSEAVSKRHPPLSQVWLVTDARNDTSLEAIMSRLPRGSGVIFRHYHLPPRERRARFDALRRVARRRNHLLVLAGQPREAATWGADGTYCAPAQAGASGRKANRPSGTRFPPARGILLLTAHSLREVGQASRGDAVVLSPVFATRSHPGAWPLGPIRFRLLASRSQVPVIALGGMTARRARALGARRWAAIDGLSTTATRGISKDS